MGGTNDANGRPRADEPAGRRADDVTSLSYAFPLAFPGRAFEDTRSGLTPRRAAEAAGSDHSTERHAARATPEPAPASPLASPAPIPAPTSQG